MNTNIHWRLKDKDKYILLSPESECCLTEELGHIDTEQLPICDKTLSCNQLECGFSALLSTFIVFT